MSNSRHPPPSKAALLNKMRSASLNWSKKYFSHYLEKSIEKLFQLANSSTNTPYQQQLMAARDLLLKQQANVESSFLNSLSQAFQAFDKQQATHQSQPDTESATIELSLMDNDSLEQDLAIETLKQKISIDYSENLYTLNQRIAILRGGKKLSDDYNPISPGVFAEAIRSSYSDLLLENKTRLILYKLYEKLFMEQLDNLYQLINTHFIDQGILPNLKYQAVVNPQDIDETLPEELKPLGSNASQERQSELLRSIVLLQEKLRLLYPVSSTSTGQAISLDQLIDTLKQLQSSTIEQLQNQPQQFEDPTPAKKLREEVERNAKNSREIDTFTIEIVGLLFEYMLNDEHLPDSVKTLLSYLHTPFLKIAIVDKDFFQHPQHPARQLLNNLVAAGERWVDAKNFQRNEVYRQIKQVVEQLLNNFENDTRIFSELAFEFNRHLRQHARRIHLTEERAKQAAQGENTVKAIRLKVEHYLKQKIGPIKLPDFAERILFEPWSNYLAFNLLRFGSKSGQWQHAATAVDDLLWFIQLVQYATEPEKKPRYQELLESLPSVLEQGFNTVGYDSSQGNELLLRLKNYPTQIAKAKALIAKQQPASTEKPLDEFINASTNPDIDELEPIVETSDKASHRNIIDTLKTTPFGTWFLFNADQAENAQEVKLAWSNIKTQHFMFVNRLGQQVAVKSGAELAEAISQQQIKWLNKEEPKPFFEKALERILKQLQLRS